MKTIKKFAKEISVFGLVLIVFLALFAYRSMTYATYKTISAKKFESMVTNKESFIVVAGSADDSSTAGYQEILTKYQTHYRSPKIYFVDIADQADNYLSRIVDVDATTPVTMILKDGKVTAKKSGSMQYYTLVDFIKENSDN